MSICTSRRISLIVVETNVGEGTEADPIRRVLTLIDLDGRAIGEFDTLLMDGKLTPEAALLKRIGQLRGEAGTR